MCPRVRFVFEGFGGLIGFMYVDLLLGLPEGPFCISTIFVFCRVVIMFAFRPASFLSLMLLVLFLSFSLLLFLFINKCKKTIP